MLSAWLLLLLCAVGLAVAALDLRDAARRRAARRRRRMRGW